MTFAPTTFRTAPIAAAFVFALAAAPMLPAPAQAAPPADARPLSEIVAGLEASGDVAWFEDVEWDDDGYWEIDYVRPDGARVEIEVDPVTGEPRR